jgi:hypothetical protein
MPATLPILAREPLSLKQRPALCEFLRHLLPLFLEQTTVLWSDLLHTRGHSQEQIEHQKSILYLDLPEAVPATGHTSSGDLHFDSLAIGCLPLIDLLRPAACRKDLRSALLRVAAQPANERAFLSQSSPSL